MKLLSLFTLSVGLAVGLNTHGAITYVDAVEGASGNTGVTGQPLSDTSWVGPDDSGDNNTQWNKRAFSNGGTIFQGRYSGSGTPAFPELNTQITGLSDGLYDVWVFFWDGGGANTWALGAGLTSGSLTTYSFDGPGDTASPVAASTLTFSGTAPINSEADRIMYGVNLGQVTVSGGSDIDVFVDNLIGGSSNTRHWYDGVGYELVPEPSSLALLGLGGLFFARRCRG